MSTDQAAGTDELVLVDRSTDGVALVTMNRPKQRNALNMALRSTLFSTMLELDADPDINALVLTGADPAFCAGLDLKDLSTGGLELEVGTAKRRLPFETLTKPLIGAVNGPAVTGGFELALGCDFLIASERAAFADTHARVGVMPGWGLSVLLPQAIGRRRAHQMSFTGDYVDAAKALDWGLVNEVVAHDDLLTRALELASTMAQIPAANLAAIKGAYRTANAPFDDPALDAEQTYSAEWAAGFDADALAANREAIQARGRSQKG